MSYQLPSPNNVNRPMPMRQAPLPPTSPNTSHAAINTGTLSHYHSDFVGVPFVLNPQLKRTDFSLELPKFADKSDALEYDFQLERQILCATKGNRTSSTNPFFN